MRNLMRLLTVSVAAGVLSLGIHTADAAAKWSYTDYTSYGGFSKQTTQCLTCHEHATPFVVNDWKRSKHYYNGVGCYECHKSDESNPAAYHHYGFVISTLVTPKQCSSCHPKIVNEYTHSIHDHAGLISQHAEAKAGGNFATIVLKLFGWNPKTTRIPQRDGMGKSTWKDIINDPCWNYAGVPQCLKTSDPLAADTIKIFANWGCYSCHGTKIRIVKKMPDKVVFDLRTWPMDGTATLNPDGTRGNCASCHPFHSFSLRVVRCGRGACGRCHESEDHPNYEMYGKSMHGAAFLSQCNEWNMEAPAIEAGKDYFAPTCATCHMGAIYQDGKMIYAPTHDPASICKWKLGAWKTSFVRKAGMPHPALPSVKFPTDGLKNRERAFAMCTQCHTKQWAANCLIGGDLSMATLDHIRKISLKVESDLDKRGLATPLDRVTVRDIGAMAVRPTEIAMFHYAPGYIWWDGIFKASNELVEWLVDSVQPRLGTNYVNKYVPWVREHEIRVKRYRSEHHI